MKVHSPAPELGHQTTLDTSAGCHTHMASLLSLQAALHLSLDLLPLLQAQITVTDTRFCETSAFIINPMFSASNSTLNKSKLRGQICSK